MGYFLVHQFFKKIIPFRFKKCLPEKRGEAFSESLPVSGRLEDLAIMPKQTHPIHQGKISQNALVVLIQLERAGYKAYLVGGSVRDLLLSGKPKDFDIATDALPEQVRSLFRNRSRLIGKRFKIVHVYFGAEIIEVTTFRGSHGEQDHPEGRSSASGFLVRDNVYGSIEEDAWRRDFSVNALYYYMKDSSVIDYTGGMLDLDKKLIRILGEASVRYREDPVRILRAIRFAAKLNFSLERKTAAPIASLKHLLKDISGVRLFEEVLKLFYCGDAVRAFQLIQDYGLFELLFPQTHAVLSDHPRKGEYLRFIQQSCGNTDKRVREDLSLSPAFLFSVLVWPALEEAVQDKVQQGRKEYTAFEKSVTEVLNAQLKVISIPRRYLASIRNIWSIQRIMEKRAHKRIEWILSHPRFRAAYDFLVLRFEAGEAALEPIIRQWTDMQAIYPLKPVVPSARLGKKIGTQRSYFKQRRKEKKK